MGCGSSLASFLGVDYTDFTHTAKCGSVSVPASNVSLRIGTARKAHRNATLARTTKGCRPWGEGRSDLIKSNSYL